jgi:membrane-associated phospholipid phosphatase
MPRMKSARLPLGRALSRPKTLWSLAVLVGSAVFCFAVSEMIQWLYPERSVVPDLLFTLLPNIPFLAYLTDPIMAAAIVLILWYAITRGRDHLPYYFFSVGIVYFGRGLLMALTPLGRPTGNLESYGIFRVVQLKQHGMFPSGHVTLAAAIYFLIDGKRHPGFKRAAGLLALAEIVTLLLSRGHYSIDVAGGIMLGWLTILLLEGRRERFRLRRQNRAEGPRSRQVSQ